MKVPMEVAYSAEWKAREIAPTMELKHLLSQETITIQVPLPHRIMLYSRMILIMEIKLI